MLLPAYLLLLLLWGFLWKPHENQLHYITTTSLLRWPPHECMQHKLHINCGVNRRTIIKHHQCREILINYVTTCSITSG